MEAKPDLKSMTKKERAGYIWDYYKWFIIGGIVAIIVIVSTVRNFLSQKDPVFEFVALNCENFTLTSEQFDEYLTMKGYDTSKEEVTVVNTILISDNAYTGDIDANAYASTMQLAAMFAAQEVDILIGRGQAYSVHANEGALLDLREYLSDEELSSIGEDNILYCINEEDGFNYPCAIILDGNKWIDEHPFYYSPCYIGVGVRSEHQTEAIDFIKYILEY